jgi:hypothetical protein
MNEQHKRKIEEINDNEINVAVEKIERAIQKGLLSDNQRFFVFGTPEEETSEVFTRDQLKEEKIKRSEANKDSVLVRADES